MNHNDNRMKKTNKYIRLLTAALALIVGGLLPAFSLPTEHYATTSRLASGKWVKVRANEEGMYLLSRTQLRNMGFSDPAKVRIYGYGARQISEALDENQIDDLPMLPSVLTAKGLVFFSAGTVGWKYQQENGLRYKHTSNSYSSESYYFVSDCDQSEPDFQEAPVPASANRKASTYTEHLLHEQDMQAPSNSGRVLLGEDFRSKTMQTFNFDLKGNTGADVNIAIAFATYTSGASSSLSLTANGESISAGTGDVIPAVASSEAFMTYKVFPKTVTTLDTSDKLALGIKYNPGGALSLARLDYIRVDYERALKFDGPDQLFSVSPNEPTVYTVSNCPADVQLWEVTNAGRPLSVVTIREGDKLSFTASTGYHRYVLFVAENVTRAATAAGTVSNQNLHGREVPDMVIISPREYLSEAERLAELHRQDDGMVVYALTPEEIYNEFSSGAPDASAFRKALKMWYDRSDESRRLGYCLIFARPTYDNLGVSERVRALSYPRVPMWLSPTGYTQVESYGTDDFIAMLDDNSRELSMSSAKVRIAVGRLPVRSLQEAKQAVDKIYNYTRKPSYGSWRNRVVLLADDQDGAIHLTQSQDVYNLMRSSGNGEHFDYERLYIDAYQRTASSSGYQYPTAKEKMMQLFQDGIFYFNYIGHANPRALTGDNMFNWTDINSMTNRNLPFMYMATCEFLRWDDDNISGAEILWQYPESGVIGMIAATRSVYMSANGTLSNAIASNLFARDSEGNAKRVGDVMIDGKNRVNDTNRLRYVLMGDPAMRLASPKYKVVVDAIDGVDLRATTPQIKASSTSTVTGRIVDPEGNLVEDFNGFIESTLYDAETVVETYGHGSDGESVMYNDRTSRLFVGKQKVENGRWSVQLLTPPHIENNFSPGLLLCYAYSNDGMEANGSTQRFYVFGVPEEDSNDENPPVITAMTLNGEGFSEGDIVNQNPVLRASITDEETGINAYGAAIGQQMCVTIGAKTYTNVADFFVPREGDPYSGDIIFPLDEIEPGEHTLTLSVWDNAGNGTSRDLAFRVAIGRSPVIYDVTTDCNPASTSVTFSLRHDRPAEKLVCDFEVFDLNGKKVWSSKTSGNAGYDSSVSMTWNLTDSSGMRVPRGIYLYRATVTTSEGTTSSKTRKLAVTAQ